MTSFLPKFSTLHKIPMSPNTLRWGMSWIFPAWIGAGISVDHISSDWHRARTVLPLRWYNRNYVGTHFGGSLYSMCDPMYMLQLMNILSSRDFVVWDQAGAIDYVRPGRNRVHADFVVPDELVDSLRQLSPGEKKVVDMPPIEIKDSETAEVVAIVRKTLYVRRKG